MQGAFTTRDSYAVEFSIILCTLLLSACPTDPGFGMAAECHCGITVEMKYLLCCRHFYYSWVDVGSIVYFTHQIPCLEAAMLIPKCA